MDGKREKRKFHNVESFLTEWKTICSISKKAVQIFPDLGHFYLVGKSIICFYIVGKSNFHKVRKEWRAKCFSFLEIDD
jgi:hypothetical protein